MSYTELLYKRRKMTSNTQGLFSGKVYQKHYMKAKKKALFFPEKMG